MKYRFFFHYNKPASRKAMRPIISLHWKGKCYTVSDLVVYTPVWSKFNKRQPHFVMQGYSNNIEFNNFGAAIIYGKHEN